VKQAESLLKQHLLLSKMQSEDEFVLDYMDFLVHHEFGMHAKHFEFDEGAAKFKTKDQLEYWLDLWYSYYFEILKNFGNVKGFLFFSYDEFV